MNLAAVVVEEAEETARNSPKSAHCQFCYIAWQQGGVES